MLFRSIEKKRDDASMILQRIFTKKFMIRIDETAYKNYIKYVVPKSFFQCKYDIKPLTDMRNPKCSQECYDYDVAVAKHYENQKSRIYDAKKNNIITSMTKDKFNEILEDAFRLIILKLRKLPFRTMRIFCLIRSEERRVGKECRP